MMIEVYRFVLEQPCITYFGNTTHPYPIRYVYRYSENNIEGEAK